MRNDTKRRIRLYEEKLPYMKERLSAAGLGLLVAAIVTVSATFAWVTLSRAPEVANITTTLSANGALEIALSNDVGEQPDEFDIDESVGIKVDLVSYNLQWGNLVNLSDDSYGIDNIELRPAQLNIAKLLSNPLLGAAYGEDGRVMEMDKNFAYTKYHKSEDKFLVDTTYGVRAISSYTAVKSEGAQAILEQKIKDVDTAMNTVSNTYQEAIDRFSAMGKMISTFAQDKVNQKLGSGSETGSNMGPYLADVLRFYQALYATVEDQKVAYVALANLQLYQWAAGNNQAFTPITWGQLYQDRNLYNAADPNQKSEHKTVSLSGLKQFCADAETLKQDMDKLEDYCAGYQVGNAYYWASGGDQNFQIADMISRLIDYSKTMYIEINGEKIYIGSLSMDAAMGLLKGNGKTQKVFVDGGILKRFEEIVIANSSRFGAANKAMCTVAVTALMQNITIYGEAYTTASGPSWFESDFAAASKTEVNATVTAAEDTYGMAVDFWLRTNAERTYLTLEGATVTDATTGSVLRYDGVNRVWGATGNALLSRESTTQGGGSCYVYYADTPEDQARSLALLENMKVAFMDTSTGRYMAAAVLDTEHYWAENGRITVPLVQDITQPKVVYTREEETDDSGEATTVTKEYCAISELTMDDAQRITAIIYLDGTSLSNTDVLAAASIQGQLNLQFGTSDDLQTIGSNELIDDVRTVTAEVTPTKLNFDEAVNPNDLTTAVKLTVRGAKPTTVTAFFVRAINSTQGSREGKMTFEPVSDEKGDTSLWTDEYQFTAPGTYYLRHVQLDGVDYALSEPVSVEVSGFALEDVSWREPSNEAKVRTSQGTYTEEVSVKFASSDINKMPDSVQARFVRTDGNTVIIPLTRGTGGVWKGTGTFTTSGVYKWEYLVYTTSDNTNGIYKDLGVDKKTLDLALGLYAEVRNDVGTLEDHFVSGESYTKKVTVRIFDNANNELKELEGARLYYTSGSLITAMSFDLTWQHTAQHYTGKMVFTHAGRYRFSHIWLGGNSITRVSESPTYNIISPDPLIYDENSRTTYHGTDEKNIQFVPLTCDAQIDGIKIINSSSSNILRAIVYNDKAGEYKTVEGEAVVCDGSVWTLKLPTYTRQLGEDRQEQTQDGTWSVAALLLSECYDDKGNYFSDKAPLIWVNDDEDAKAYVESEFVGEDGVKPAYTVKDFSQLSTTVSSSVQITANQKDIGRDGVVELGGSSTDFMTKFYKNNLGLTVAVTDGNGHAVPGQKIRSVELHYSYTAPTDKSYGYAVETGASEKDGILTLTRDADHGWYTVSDNTAWRYVGRYTVKDLRVEFASGSNVAEQVVKPGSSGVPTAYTITTKAPDLQENVAVLLNANGKLYRPFGKYNGVVTGTFLQSYDVGAFYAAVVLTADGEQVQYVSLGDAVSAKLKLTYLDGKQALNGGYEWSGESAYEHITLPMTKQQGSSNYVAESTPLLSGCYSAQVNVTIGSETLSQKYVTDSGNERVIEVWSKTPDVTMALANGTPEIVTVNKGGGIEYSEVFTANNEVKDGHTAILFANAEQFTTANNIGEYKYKEWDWGSVGYVDKIATDTTYSNYFADYTMPSIKFTLSNGGTVCKNFTLTVPNNNGEIAAFSSGERAEATMVMGRVEEVTKDMPGVFNDENVSYTYKAERAIVVGTQSVPTIQAQEGTVIYTLTLANELSIVQENRAVPSVTFRADNEAFRTPEGKVSEDGRSFEFTLPTELYASKDGKTYVETQTVEEGAKKTTTEGESLTDKLPTVASIQNGDWTPTTNNNPVKAYVETVKVQSESHYSLKWDNGKRHGNRNAWWKSWTQEKYWIYQGLSQTTTQHVTATGTITSVWDTDYYTVKTSLAAWDVDGVIYNPGDTIIVSGNSIVKPKYDEQKTLTQRVTTTEVTNGSTTAFYKANRVVTITVRPENDPDVTGSSAHYCVWKACATYTPKGSEAAAKTAAEDAVIPAISGYTKMAALTAGTVVSSCDSEWTQIDSSTTGSTTTTRITYDANGNVLSKSETTT